MAARGAQLAGLCVPSSSAKWPKGKAGALSTLMKEFPTHCALIQGKKQQRVRCREIRNLLKGTSPISPICCVLHNKVRCQLRQAPLGAHTKQLCTHGKEILTGPSSRNKSVPDLPREFVWQFLAEPHHGYFLILALATVLPKTAAVLIYFSYSKLTTPF